MKTVKLTKKAQDIVNQIMSADAVDIEHGPVVERVVYGNSFLSGAGLEFHIFTDGDIAGGAKTISNETLNEATIVDGIIQIDSDHIKDNHYGDMTITLYKLSKIAAV
jgi:hypothetical protein